MLKRIAGGAGCLMILLSGLSMRTLAAQQKDAPGGKPAAVIDGTIISEEELNRAAATELQNLEMQKLQFEANYAHRKQQILEDTLKRMIEEKLLDDEAAKQGITRKDLLAKEVDPKVKEPTPEEIDQVYEANKANIKVPKEQVSARIIQYLKQQSYNKAKDEYVERLKSTRKVSIALEPLRLDVAVAGYPSRGPENAPVTIVEFSDFQCPYCKNFTATLDRLMREFPSDVRVVFRQLPLREIHPMAEKAAEASLCAQEQGKFWELHDLMFKDQAALKVEDLKAKAVQLQLDSGAFNTCLESGKYEKRINEDIREGARLGANGTPAVIINGRFFSGARPFEEVAAIIKEELQKKTSASAKP